MDKKEFPTSEQASKKEYTGELPDLNNIDPTEANLFNNEELGGEDLNQTNYNTQDVFEKNEVKSKNKKVIISAIAGVSLLAAGTVTFAVNAFSNNDSKNEANQPPKSEIVSTQTSNLDNNQKVESTGKQNSNSNTESQEVTSVDTNSSNNETTSSSNNSGLTTSSENENTASVETEKSAELLVSSLEIPAGLSTDEYGNAVIELIEKWRNCGYTTPEEDSQLMDKWRNYSGVSLENFATPVAEDNAEIFTKAAFIPNYKEKPELVSLYGKLKNFNDLAIVAHLYTKLDKNNRDGSYIDCKLGTAEELFNTGSERSVKIGYYESLNMEDLTSEKNKLTDTPNQVLEFIITTEVINGTEKISDFTWISDIKTGA